MDEAPPQDSPQAAARRRREPLLACLLRHTLALLVGGVFLVLVGVGWLGATDAGLGLLAALVGKSGVLVIDAPAGHLLGPFRAAALHLSLPTLRVDIRELSVDWHPAALLHGRLEIASLAAAEVTVATPPSDEPASLPASLELPLALELAELRVERLAIGKLDHAEPDLTLAALHGALFSDGRSHRFAGLSATAPFGALTLDGHIDGRRPFALGAQAGLAMRQAGEPYRIEVKAEGDLVKLQLAAAGHGAGLAAEAQVAATPFEALPLKSAKIHVRGLDPSRFDIAVPAALLDISADLTPSAPALARGPGDWVISGPLSLVNRQPGTLDVGHLPLESLSTELRWEKGQLAATVDLRASGKGRAEGQLRWTAGAEAGGVEADLRVSGVDLKSLDARLVATRIAGTLVAHADAAEQSLAAELSDAQRSLRLKARRRGSQIDVAELLARAGAARLAASGRVALDAVGRFEARGQLSHFDPQAFVNTAPAADLNTRFSLAGQRAPQLAGRLQFDLAPSSLEGRALLGKGELAIDGKILSRADVALDLAGNRLTAQGRYGRIGDTLDLHVDAPALAALGHGLAGRVKLDGQLRGTPLRPAGEFELLADALAAGGMKIDAINARGSLQEGDAGRVALQVALAGLRSGADEALLRRAKLSLEGTRAAHQLRLEAFGRRDLSAVVALAGGLGDGLQWRGRLDALTLSGEYALKLLAPVALSVAPDEFSLARAELRGAQGGVFHLDETHWKGGELVARGHASGVQVGVALDPATRAVKGGGDSLQMGAEWDVHLTHEVNGRVRLFREKGDLVLQGDSPVELGLDELELSVSAVANRLALGASAHGTHLGKVSGAATALLERHADGALGLARAAPLLGSALLDMPSIAWAGPLADQNLKTEGRLTGEFTLAGTPDAPVTGGRIRGEGLAFTMADQGLHLSGGTLAADFNRDRLRIERFDFVSPNRIKPHESRIDVAALTTQPGSLAARGEVLLASGVGNFSFKAVRLPLLQRLDQWLVISGEGEVVTGWNSASITGRLGADAGLIEVSRTPAPSLGDDVEVLGPTVGGKAAESAFHMAVDLAIDLGNALYVKGLGLDTRLAGELRLRSGDGQGLRATGLINTQGGVYEGYGQKLAVEKGILSFTGAIANPGLNVLALRKGLSVEAGVAITGTARRPVVKLVSEPNVPDPEKLSWIVLGRSPEQGSGGELALLLPAAQALLGVGQGMSAGLANALGVDELSFGASVDSRTRVQTSSVAGGNLTGASSSASASVDSTPGQVITLGKRLSTRTLLSFEQSVTGASSLVKLSYQLTRRIAVIGRAGSENALDAVYTISFR